MGRSSESRTSVRSTTLDRISLREIANDSFESCKRGEGCSLVAPLRETNRAPGVNWVVELPGHVDKLPRVVFQKSEVFTNLQLFPEANERRGLRWSIFTSTAQDTDF